MAGFGQMYTDPVPVTVQGGIVARLDHQSAVTDRILISNVGTTLYGGFVSNPSTTAMAYLQCFDANSIGAVTLGTTVPKEVIHVPPLATFTEKWATVTSSYSNGLVIAATTDVTNANLVQTALKTSLYFK